LTFGQRKEREAVSKRTPYDELGLIGGHIAIMAVQLVDSQVETTRAFWRRRYFGATDSEAADPRPFKDVLAGRMPRIAIDPCLSGCLTW
jgi:hypothetical protein